MQCPSCKGSRVFRSRSRTPAEKILHTVLPVRHYRCHDCNWRGIRVHRRTLRVTLLLVVGLIAGFLVYEVLGPITRMILHLLLS
jgi:hypothetical protein